MVEYFSLKLSREIGDRYVNLRVTSTQIVFKTMTVSINKEDKESKVGTLQELGIEKG